MIPSPSSLGADKLQRERVDELGLSSWTGVWCPEGFLCLGSWFWEWGWGYETWVINSCFSRDFRHGQSHTNSSPEFLKLTYRKCRALGAAIIIRVNLLEYLLRYLASIGSIILENCWGPGPTKHISYQHRGVRKIKTQFTQQYWEGVLGII